jgi:hypothetical protein
MVTVNNKWSGCISVSVYIIYPMQQHVFPFFMQEIFVINVSSSAVCYFSINLVGVIISDIILGALRCFHVEFSTEDFQG